MVSEINSQLRHPSLWPFISLMLGEILNLRNMLNPPRRSYLSGLNASEEHRCVTSFTNARRERKPKTSEDGKGANDFWGESYSQDVFVMVRFTSECSAVNGHDLTSLNFCSVNDWAQTWICLTPCGCFIFMTSDFFFFSLLLVSALLQCFTELRVIRHNDVLTAKITVKSKLMSCCNLDINESINHTHSCFDVIFTHGLV